jgi:hypothetical protein
MSVPTSTLPPTNNIGYAILDTNNNVLSVNWMPFPQWISSQPPSSVALTSAQLEMMYAGISIGTVYVYSGGGFLAIPATPAIEAIQTNALSQIDANAETCRQQYITAGLGQMLVYQAKSSMAQAFVAEYPTAASAAGVNPNLWPLLQDEIDITAADLWSVAKTILAIGNIWIIAAAMIENLRLGAKVAVASAETSGEVSAVLSGCVFPVLGVPAGAGAAPSGSLLTSRPPSISFPAAVSIPNLPAAITGGTPTIAPAS